MPPITLIDLLESAAAADSEKIAYSFYFEGGQQVETLTLGSLRNQARAIAATLSEFATPGERVLVICNPGLSFASAFFGCLYGGFVAVPVPPPAKKATDQRIQKIAADAGVRLVLGAFEQLREGVGGLGNGVQVINASEIPESRSELWKVPDISADSLAFLQYTSGSTGRPKGVMVSHRNVLCNAAHMHSAFELTPDERSVLWLPLFHDMGLMAGVIQTIFSGYHTLFLSPSVFMNYPLTWLQLMSERKATVSGGPNFAYELCVRAALRAGCPDLNLSSWKIAFNGSETVRAETLRRFAETFGRCGFRSSAFRPCYGLAEATLLVSQNNSPRPYIEVDSEALGRGQVEIPLHGNGKPLVCAGQVAGGLEIAIVDPERMERREQNQVGEIWVSGPSVAQGYWRREEETRATFRAQLNPVSADGRVGPYLRTGDLGFQRNNELYITGRLKDLIIIRGRNYYPQDIEATAESSHPALRAGCGAAISIEVESEERLVLVQELSRDGLKADMTEIIQSIREKVAHEHQVAPSDIVLIRTGTIPKTTSGKIRRQACRQLYLEGRMEIVAQSQLDGTGSTVTARAIDDAEARATQQLLELIARVVGCKVESLDPTRALNTLGLDSMMALELKMSVESATGIDVPISRLLGDESITKLRQWIQSESQQKSAVPQRSETSRPVLKPFALSAGQRALWFLAQLDTRKSPLTIARLVRIRGELDAGALRESFCFLVERHPSLRIQVKTENGEPYQWCGPAQVPDFVEEDAYNWGEKQLTSSIQEEVARPFDLENGPVLRIHLYRRAPSETTLLFCASHFGIDLWSLTLLVRELPVLYESFRTGVQVLLPQPARSYADYVEWQTSMLAGPEGEGLWRFWHERLHDAPPGLDLGIARTGTASGETQSHRFEIPAVLSTELKALASSGQVTLHTLLLAAFELQLYRYSGQKDFLLGVLSTGRTRSIWREVVGYFVNPVVLRPDISASSSFEQHLKRSRSELLQALDHSDYPFAALVEKLHPTRSWRTAPLVQVLCMLQPAAHGDRKDLASFSLGCSGSSFSVSNLQFESLNSDFERTQFELVFAAAESGGVLQAVFHFDTGRFEADAIASLAADYIKLLELLIKNSHLPISCIPLLTQPEADEALTIGTRARIEDVCIHHAIQQQAARSPEKIALVFESAELSYAKLDVRANQLAHFLRQAGAGPETAIGVYLERSLEMMIVLLGILKAGAAYVPLDPTYPPDRIEMILEQSKLKLMVTTQELSRRLPKNATVQLICLNQDAEKIALCDPAPVEDDAGPDNLAYLMFTSGSTGRPKGVMISHRNVINFFRGMDGAVGCGPDDTLLAVTSISFDISVLELLWTLSRGARVVLAKDELNPAAVQRRQFAASRRPLEFSLFYFASTDSGSDSDRYGLLLEGTKLADQLGFEAVWTPERHFHPFGGLYPNPSVTSSALAAITNRIRIRAGSVVLPLQNPVRVAEEWALVDNLSRGRTGVAFASGWHADDFVFFPEHYERRRQIMLEGIETVRKLWRGETLEARGGSGNTIRIRTYPRPVQRELPIWLTSGGTLETFIAAAEIRANVLTHLLGQDVKDVAERIQAYRKTLEKKECGPDEGAITLMLHAYVDDTEEKVRDEALVPFKQYLESSAGLVATLIRSLKLDVNLDKMTEKDRDDLVAFAAERYLGSSGLFGTEKTCLEMVDQLVEIGVNEIACLVDFGIETGTVLQSIERIRNLWTRFNRKCQPTADYSIAAQLRRYGATMMQCTPSLLRIIAQNQDVIKAVGSMRALLLGGEAVPASIVKESFATGVGAIYNMYGPTETTIWSAALKLDPEREEIAVGGAIVNTQLHILNAEFMPAPVGVTGEVYIGGAGLARGYVEEPALTAERFVPDPFAQDSGSRLYRTGDLGKLKKDGTIELLGRTDQQLKICGHRIEHGDPETHVNALPGVQAAVVVKHGTGDAHTERLAAFIVPSQGNSLDTGVIRDLLKLRLPHYMVPNDFCIVNSLPLTANGKIDRKAVRLPKLQRPARNIDTHDWTDLEQTIANVWKTVLQVDSISIDDNFFDIGGHSLLMVQAHQKIQHLLGREFPLLTMLERPTVRAIARHLSGQAELNLESSRERALRERNAFLARRDRNLAERKVADAAS